MADAAGIVGQAAWQLYLHAKNKAIISIQPTTFPIPPHTTYYSTSNAAFKPYALYTSPEHVSRVPPLGSAARVS